MLLPTAQLSGIEHIMLAWPMNSSHNYPKPIKRIHDKGFVDYTITHRLPKILTNIENQLERQFETAQIMLQAIITGSPLTPDSFIVLRLTGTTTLIS